MTNFPFDVKTLWSSVSNLESKEKIAKQLVSIANDGDVIGFGSGTTSMVCALEFGHSVKDGLAISAVVTSYELAWLCDSAGIKVVNLNDVNNVDWCFDGADEVDASNNLLKGRGGAMHNERLVFDSAIKRYIVADNSKDVNVLGEKFRAPLEIDPKKMVSVYRELNKMNLDSVAIRLAGSGSKDGPVITEAGNCIIDVVYRAGFNNILIDQISLLDGVFDTGLFIGYEFERIS